MFLFLYRTIKFAVQGFFRNFWLSLVTIIILVLTIFSITVVAGINVVAEQAIESVQDKIDVSIYFKPGVSEEEVINVRDRLQELSLVESVLYVSKSEALEKFRVQHQDDQIILDSIDQLEENPLSATIVVKANNLDDYPTILAVLENPEIDALVLDKNFDDNKLVISRLSDLSDKIKRVGIIISSIFVVIAILIVFNTIRINIYTHREEIAIMKLVGSSNWFVRVPFIFESIMYAIIAVIISVAILYPLLGLVAPQVSNFFDGYNLDLIEYASSNFLRIVGLQFAFAVILSVLSSSLAIGRYTRV
ncbi:FtsX-like permease family protein [Patescibacteria group bacterium]|nr:FtsX-like permease family protein [Patescibacteria group bacterium]